jgi:2-polyprenyl-3-methyl-5-hydroxy-6-metoxy-1,4-benzoquinol methylase
VANKRGKAIDKTSLDIELATNRGQIHRDYLAHAFRWTHAAKMARIMKNKLKGKRKLRILDIGCGRHMPFAKVLISNRLGSFVEYTGIDALKFEVPDVVKNAKRFEHQVLNFPYEDTKGFNNWFDLVVCFETLEHMEPDAGMNLLTRARRQLNFAGRMLLSTPNYNGSSPANHVAEWEHDLLGFVLEELGFVVEAEYGTFASQLDYKPWLFENYIGSEKIFYELRKFYDSQVLATIFAPLLPEGVSRNTIWSLQTDQAPFWQDRKNLYADYKLQHSTTGTSSDQEFPWKLMLPKEDDHGS